MKILTTILAGAAAWLGIANATTYTFDDQTSFWATLDSYTLIDTSANIGKTTAQLSAETAGATFTGPASYVRSDGLIINGQGFFGATTPHVGMNFDAGVNAVGVWSNLYDGGRIQVYSGLDGTGALLGEYGFGGNTGAELFGGIITDQLIRSVVFTCDFNYDLACGLIDPSFGIASSLLSQGGQVPVPGAAVFFATAVAGATTLRSRKKNT